MKYPEPGRVKTRLAATVGAEAATEIYRKLVAEVCRSLPPEAVLSVQFDPPGRRAEVEAWFREMCGDRLIIQYEPQAAGDLGRRLAHAFEAAFRQGFTQAAAIGSDCIELTPEIFEKAWAQLDAGCDAAIGPSADGGYYLIALGRSLPILFQRIAWSTDAVLAQTLDRAREAGLRAALLPELHDVDTEHDWRRAQLRMKC